MTWSQAVRLFDLWFEDAIGRDTVRDAWLKAGGEWCDNTGGGCPVGMLELNDGTLATVALDSIIRWRADAYSRLDLYLADPEPDEDAMLDFHPGGEA